MVVPFRPVGHTDVVFASAIKVILQVFDTYPAQ